VEDIFEIYDEIFADMRQAIIRTDGTYMNQETINELFDQLRGAAPRVKQLQDQQP